MRETAKRFSGINFLMKHTKTLKLVAALVLTFSLYGCWTGAEKVSDKPGGESGRQTSKPDRSTEAAASDAENRDSKKTGEGLPNVRAPGAKTARDFFMLLPYEFFEVPGCDETADKNCAMRKEGYLEDCLGKASGPNFLDVGCGEGEDPKLKMVVFGHSESGKIVGLNVLDKRGSNSRFLGYENGNWEDVSLEIVPEYSSSNIYEFDKDGRKIPVFAKRIIQQKENYEVSGRGEKLYDLEWADGEFSIKK